MFLKFLRKTLLFLLFTVLLMSCQSVKPYQRAYLNDRDMAFGSSAAKSMELKTQAYREGAVDTGKGKSAGGCGCR